MITTKEIALQFYEPLRSGDFSKIDDFLAPNWQDIPLNKGQSQGSKGYVEMVKKLRSFIPDLVWDIDDVIIEKEKVVVRSTISGNPDVKVIGLHITGKPVKFSAIDIHKISDEKISITWHVEDKLGVFSQFGISHISFR
jgi:predicted ester cyclase